LKGKKNDILEIESKEDKNAYFLYMLVRYFLSIYPSPSVLDKKRLVSKTEAC